MQPEVATRVPFFAGLFSDLYLQPLIRGLQKDSNLAAASKMIFGEIGKHKDNSAKVRDSFDVSPELLGKFLAVLKNSVSSSVKVGASPLQNVKPISFEAEKDMYDNYLKTTLASSGINSNLIFTSDTKPNTVETQLSLNSDEQMMFSLYAQFNNFLEYHINNLTKKFKFTFEFEGSQFYTNRKQRFEDQMKLAEKGIVLPQKIAASIGMKPANFRRQMEEARANDWVETLTPIVSSFQMSGDKGRPEKGDSDLTESGEQTRSDGGNDEIKG